MKNLIKIVGGGLLLVAATGAQADQVIVDDLIVQGSSCVGQDCANGEAFGFDTIRLKENNLRIKAEDTSASASFPANDWQLTFNETSNGGLNKFSVDDVTGGKTPLTIEANAPSHSLYVDDGGRLGLGTSTPVVDVHVVSGNTPTLRLEQDGTSGFTAQTWDMAGNESNFFIRDVTNGSTLPFRVRPGAPSSAIDVDSDGDVRLGNSSASDFQISVLQDSGTGGFKLATASGGVNFQLDPGNTGNFWNFTAQTDANGGFVINNNDGPGSVEFLLKPNGTLVLESSCIQLGANACTAGAGSFTCVAGACP